MTSSSYEIAPRLTPRLIQIAREITRTHQPPAAAGVGPGTATAAGRAVAVSPEVRDGLAAVLDDIDGGREAEPGPRIAALLGKIQVARRIAEVFEDLPNGASIVAASIAVALGSGNDGSTTGEGARQTWANQIASQRAQPLSIARPTSLDDPNDPQSVQAVLAGALANGCAARAAGSGHSYSDVATTPDFFIDTHGLDRLADPANPIAGQLSPSVLRSTLPLALGPVAFSSYDPANNHALVEMEAGITIRALNPALESWNLGLMNMGGYDGQTIMGATSTSTHGSGIGIGPFPDMVRSLVLATTGEWNGTTISGGGAQKGVRYYRIEPAAGITDPDKYSDPRIALIQDDNCFHAVICGMGCLGVIYSVVLEVMQMYYLTETRYLTTLDQVLKDLKPDRNNGGKVPGVLQDYRHYEVLTHPYPMLLTPAILRLLGKRGASAADATPADSTASFGPTDPEALLGVIPMKGPVSLYYRFFLCLVTERNIAPPPEQPKDRIIMPSFLAILLNLILDKEPELIPDAITISLITQIDTDWVGKSYVVFNVGLGGNFGFASEIGFSVEDDAGDYTRDNFQSAIDSIASTAQTSRVQGRQYQTSAFSLRFVKASAASLSMMQGRNTAMIEMDMLTGTYAGAEIMYRYETGMYPLGGRPHWGLEFDFLSGSNGLLQRLYPRLGDWLAVYGQLNAKGTFNNSFTQRVGFTQLVTPPPPAAE